MSMSMGYIDREEVMNAIQKYKGYYQDQISTDHLLTKIEAMCIISDIGEKDVEQVVHAEWVVEDRISNNATCSNCGNIFQENYRDYPYCPACGARMDGGHEQ